MAYHLPPTSPVTTKFLAPLVDAYAGSQRKYACTELGDLDFLESGILRCISAVTSGRDFLQQHGDQGRKDIPVGLFFKALKSGRRLANLESVCANVTRLVAARAEDPYAGIRELTGFDIYAGDGHFHEAACHDPHKPKKVKLTGKKGERAKVAKKRQTGHFFLLGMRDHHLRHLTLAEIRPGGGNEHDMHAIKRKQIKALRCDARVGQKVMMVWDPAGIDFGLWADAKRAGIYFISREKANMKLMPMGQTPGFNRAEPRNAGVSADEFVGPGGSGGSMMRRVTYTDEKGTTYKFLTTEFKLPAWVIVLLYKQRWDIEKVFDEIKNKMLERKSWASGKTAKTVHANFLCLTHNLMLLLEGEIEEVEQIGNRAEEERKDKVEEGAKKLGANYIAIAIQRITVRSVKFVRWLRNFIYRDVPWGAALARLAIIYATR
jgi:hypothetical protein